jgi:hypothetical protein
MTLLSAFAISALKILIGVTLAQKTLIVNKRTWIRLLTIN